MVFDYVSDLRHMPTWWPTHRSYHRLAGSGGLRTVYAWVMPHSPLPFGMPIGGITIVTALERPTRFSYRIVSIGLCTDQLFDPQRPVIWTETSLTRALDLYDPRGFYA